MNTEQTDPPVGPLTMTVGGWRILVGVSDIRYAHYLAEHLQKSIHPDRGSLIFTVNEHPSYFDMVFKYAFTFDTTVFTTPDLAQLYFNLQLDLMMRDEHQRV